MIFRIKKKYQRPLLTFAIALIVAGFYFIINPPQLLDKKEGIFPPSFAEAYSAALNLSSVISEAAEEATVRINEINEADRKGDYIRAFNLTVEQAKQHEGLRMKSVELLAELQKMAASVEQIDSPTVQQLILQAVSTQVSLVSHLLIYNERWISLLNHLRNKFLSAEPWVFNPETEELIQKINDEIEAINKLNRKYNTLIEELRGVI